MTCTILQNYGTTGQLEDTRSFDAWGNASAIGNQQVNPKGRYCANLGHKSDDESGLVYMRARYEDPSTGRFVSEDPSRNGVNWYSYCNADPVNGVDKSGKSWIPIEALEFVVAGLFYLLGQALLDSP